MAWWFICCQYSEIVTPQIWILGNWWKYIWIRIHVPELCDVATCLPLSGSLGLKSFRIPITIFLSPSCHLPTPDCPYVVNILKLYKHTGSRSGSLRLKISSDPKSWVLIFVLPPLSTYPWMCISSQTSATVIWIIWVEEFPDSYNYFPITKLPPPYLWLPICCHYSEIV